MNSRYSHTLKWLNEQHDVVIGKITELERKVSHLQKEVDELRAGKADKRGPKPKSTSPADSIVSTNPKLPADFRQ